MALINALQAVRTSPTSPQAVTTIQLTHKKWKGYKVVGTALFHFGF